MNGCVGSSFVPRSWPTLMTHSVKYAKINLRARKKGWLESRPSLCTLAKMEGLIS